MGVDIFYMVPLYPSLSDISIDFRPTLHPLFKGLKEGISEFTFANIYLFRETHNYQISGLGEGLFLITGSDQGRPFFMLPFGFPEREVLDELSQKLLSLKFVSESKVPELTGM